MLLFELNTEDPALVGASLEGEYALCQQTVAWSDEVLRGVALTSIKSSFANADTKARLLGALAQWPLSFMG